MWCSQPTPSSCLHVQIDQIKLQSAALTAHPMGVVGGRSEDQGFGGSNKSKEEDMCSNPSGIFNWERFVPGMNFDHFSATPSSMTCFYLELLFCLEIFPESWIMTPSQRVLFFFLIDWADSMDLRDSEYFAKRKEVSLMISFGHWMPKIMGFLGVRKRSSFSQAHSNHVKIVSSNFDGWYNGRHFFLLPLWLLGPTRSFSFESLTIPVAINLGRRHSVAAQLYCHHRVKSSEMVHWSSHKLPFSIDL